MRLIPIPQNRLAYFSRRLSRQHRTKISRALKGRGKGGEQEKVPNWLKNAPAQRMAASYKGRFGFKNVGLGYMKGNDKRLYTHAIYRGPLGLAARGRKQLRLTRREEKDLKRKIRAHNQRQTNKMLNS